MGKLFVRLLVNKEVLDAVFTRIMKLSESGLVVDHGYKIENKKMVRVSMSIKCGGDMTVEERDGKYIMTLNLLRSNSGEVIDLLKSVGLKCSEIPVLGYVNHEPYTEQWWE